MSENSLGYKRITNNRTRVTDGVQYQSMSGLLRHVFWGHLMALRVLKQTLSFTCVAAHHPCTYLSPFSPSFPHFSKTPFLFFQSFANPSLWSTALPLSSIFSLACLHPNNFSQYYFLRVIFCRVSVDQVPLIEFFVGLDSPMLKYLDFLLLLVKLEVDHLWLSVTHLLIQQGYLYIPHLLFWAFCIWWVEMTRRSSIV